MVALCPFRREIRADETVDETNHGARGAFRAENVMCAERAFDEEKDAVRQLFRIVDRQMPRHRMHALAHLDLAGQNHRSRRMIDVGKFNCCIRHRRSAKCGVGQSIGAISDERVQLRQRIIAGGGDASIQLRPGLLRHTVETCRDKIILLSEPVIEARLGCAGPADDLVESDGVNAARVKQLRDVSRMRSAAPFLRSGFRCLRLPEPAPVPAFASC